MSGPGPPGFVARWLAPDLALALALVTLFYCVFVFEGYRGFFRDADTGWHIVTGERILDSGALPRSDPYSFSKPGAPWIAWEWLADAGMGWVHRRAGLAGITVLFAVLAAAAVWLWVRLTWAAGGDFLVACLLLPPAISTASLHWLARPHVAGWLLLLVALWRAESAPTRFRWRDAAALLALGALWANVHASFFLGAAVFWLYAAGWLLRGWLWEAGDALRARWLALAGIVLLAGTLLNPNLWRLHQHVVAYLADTELLARVAEFQSFNFHVDGAAQVLLTVLLAALGFAAAWPARQPGRALLTLLLLAVALRSARGLPVLALAALPLANGSLSALLRAGAGLRPALRERLGEFFRYSGNLRTLDTRLTGWATLPVGVWCTYLLATTPAIAARTGFDPGDFPVAESAHVAALPPDARLYAPDKYGGYLIYRFRGSRPVFFDGRSDFYGAAFLRRYIRLAEARPGWSALVREYGFTHALLAKDAPLGAALEAAGWRRLAAGNAALLLEAPSKAAP